MPLCFELFTYVFSEECMPSFSAFHLKIIKSGNISFKINAKWKLPAQLSIFAISSR